MRIPRVRFRIRLSPRELAITAGVLAGVTAFALIGSQFAASASQIPRETPGLLVAALLSMGRMTAAFLLSLIFAVVYGFVAGTRPATRPYLLPLLDVGQSVPIPALFPVVMVVFVQTTASLFGSPRLGMEIGCIFLIFSVQVWNIAFGVYEAITQIPEDLKLAASAFGFSPYARFVHLYLPACLQKIIYNSIASWANGWYFLTLCEVLDPVRGYRVEGIGSYLGDSINPEFDPMKFVAGLSFVFAMVFGLEFFLWRPLSAWSRKFRYDSTTLGDSEDDDAYVLRWWRRSAIANRFRLAVPAMLRPVRSAILALRNRMDLAGPAVLSKWAPRLARASFFGFFGGISILTIVGVGALAFSLMRPWPESAFTVPLALAKSAGRITGAYLLTLTWTIPVALWVARKPRLDRIVTPAAEVLAAVPAVAVWPLLARVVQPTFGTNTTSILMLMTGMQWYLLFNLIEGVKRVPADLLEASQSLGLVGYRRIRYLFFPAMAPALVTGSVTGFGGGWNALIVAEHFEVGHQTYECDGIGSRLMTSSGEHGDPVSLALNMVAMLLAVAILNRLLWHRLYNYAESRFRFD
ncbi:MAG: ABC transporter permease subunit [Planctomycetes bacterium]|nr:ABC transporter permease subunit [Planctomycetota bacterium]